MSRKRRKTSAEVGSSAVGDQNADQSTDEKLAILSSIFEKTSQQTLLENLTSCAGSVEAAIDRLLNGTSSNSPSRRLASTLRGIQTSLTFGSQNSNARPDSEMFRKPVKKQITKKGKTLYLYAPSDIAQHTPCSIIHNFLPADLANELLHELLPETASYGSATFRLFENVVKSPHTACFYVDSLAEVQHKKSSYLYNGSTLSDVREILPTMRKVSHLVEEAVNNEIQHRIKHFYPGGKKLKFQHPGPWLPNAAFVNCYDGAQQSVGYHTDQLSYLGPHPVIGSLSLGVQREFRIRRIIPKPEIDQSDSMEAQKAHEVTADAQGQISLPLPHNSLLVMHAEMQEAWKHSIAPAPGSNITPHPIAGRKRINITYRHYREDFAPEYTPRCRCGVPCVLKSVMKQRENLGRYVWMCQTSGKVSADEHAVLSAGSTELRTIGADGGKGCGYFSWAEFDEDGAPLSCNKEISASLSVTCK